MKQTSEMARMISVATFFLLGIFSGLIKAKSSKPQGESDSWWEPILHLIEDPCTPYGIMSSSGFPSETSSIFPEDHNQQVKNRKCLPLNLTSVKSAAGEGEELTEELLNNKQGRRHLKGRFFSLVRKLRCALNVCVPFRKRQDFTHAQTKVIEDLIQLGSFAYYLNQSQSSFKGKRYMNVKNKIAQLTKKIEVISCQLRPALTKSALEDYITRNDIPVDLRHRKRGPRGRVATYVILEKVQTYLRDLPYSYKTSAFKLCKH